jgi:hypothetical protein
MVIYEYGVFVRGEATLGATVCSHCGGRIMRRSIGVLRMRLTLKSRDVTHTFHWGCALQLGRVAAGDTSIVALSAEAIESRRPHVAAECKAAAESFRRVLLGATPPTRTHTPQTQVVIKTPQYTKVRS